MRDSRPVARRRRRRPDVWAVAMVQCIQAAHAWDISRQSPPVVRLYSLLCRTHVEMLDWQGDCDDITHHLAGLFACEALGQKACKTHALQKARKDSVHTCPVGMQRAKQRQTLRKNRRSNCRTRHLAAACIHMRGAAGPARGARWVTTAALRACMRRVRDSGSRVQNSQPAPQDSKDSATSQVQARACSHAGHTRRESARESALQHRLQDLAQTKDSDVGTCNPCEKCQINW